MKKREAVAGGWRAPERQLVEAGLWKLRPGYNFQFSTNKPDRSQVEGMAQALYEAYRGGLADWHRLTPENKHRWCRAASHAIGCVEDEPMSSPDEYVRTMSDPCTQGGK
jgi:hypothetical protein